MENQGVTDRQLAASVRFQREITISSHEIDGSPLTGYVAGFDDETIFLAIPGHRGDPSGEWYLRKILIHRDGYSTIELHDRSTLSTEPPEVRKLLHDLISKFRERILEDYFPNRT